MAIYFISDGEYIKIGYTKGDPKDRLASLQSGNARQLTLVSTISGNITKKQTLHQRFHHLKARGEWFQLTEEIEKFINFSETEKEQEFLKPYIDPIGLDVGVDAWFQRCPKDQLHKILQEVTKSCEQAYRRGFQQGFEVCKEIIKNKHPVEYRKSGKYWHPLLLTDSNLSLHEALNKISSQICKWRFAYDYHKATVAPTTFPEGWKIPSAETAMKRHKMEFRNSSSFLSYLGQLDSYFQR